jgi:predicted nucleotidyltransferase component of viral defense system
MPSNKKSVKNMAESVRARLFNLAKQHGREFNALLKQFFQERLLYRLSQSPHKPHLVLKGALLLLPYNLPLTRPTRDIDFLGQGVSSDPGKVKTMMMEIVRNDFPDGVLFNHKSITASMIKEGDAYSGVRCKIEAHLGAARDSIQVDIGFGDAPTGGKREKDFPVLLPLPIPSILVYPMESALAEKFQASVQLDLAGSRMKDYYDMLFLASQVSFEWKSLANAIKQTFDQRGTPLSSAAMIFREEFKNNPDKEKQWVSFIKRAGLKDIPSFPQVLNQLEVFLRPFVSGKPQTSWNPILFRWE